MRPLLLKPLKHLHAMAKPGSSRFGRNWHMFPNKEYASGLIAKTLAEGRPTMIARLGSTEMLCMTNYLGVKYPEMYKSIKGYITNQTPPWWWNPSAIHQIQNWSGFFPARIDMVERFCELMIEDLRNVDILGSWLKEESFFSEELSGAKKVMLEDLEPFFAPNPWTRSLEGKKVLVVHPFANTIARQYERREKLFDNQLLPAFELKVVRAVQSIAGQKTEFRDWFEALDSMKEQLASSDFDVCILGCGAYGFPLASFAKKLGKQAIHLGGVTQLLFGIKGARWEQYIVYPYMNLFNEYWVRPCEDETPKQSNLVEGGCYW